MLPPSAAHGQSADRFPSTHRPRVEQAAQASLALLTEWFGPAPLSHTNLDEVPASWLLFERDRTLERSVVASVTRQYWSSAIGRHDLTPFEDAIVGYTAQRVIDQELGDRNRAVVGFFGGTMRFPLRLAAEAFDTPLIRGLRTIERYAGWPAMIEALALLRASPEVRLEPATLATALSAIRGSDVRLLIAECLRPDATFDYAIADVGSALSGDTIQTSLSIVRSGSGVFEIGTDVDPERSMPLLLRLADGTELREWFDGRAERMTLVYSTSSRLILAAIDPEAMVLRDQNRTNNTFTAAPAIRSLGLRLSLHWVSWLQQMMLTYSAMV